MSAIRSRGSLLLGVAVAAALGAGAVSAHAAPTAIPPSAVTIGSNLASPANESGPCGLTTCTVTNLTLRPESATTGGFGSLPGGLTSPVNGTVTSWRFRSNSTGQSVSLRVLRPVNEMTFTGVGTSSPATSAVGINGPFATSLPIQVGDRVGLDASAGAIILNDVGAPWQALSWTMPPLTDGDPRTGDVVFNREVLVEAVVVPTDILTFGKVTRNKRRGTATLTVGVPNPGNLDYGGVKVNVAETAAKPVSAGQIKFLIKAAGRKRKRLNKEGTVKVTPVFLFAPLPTPHAKRTQSTTITLKKKLKE
jgi:hypothetical protein